MYSLNTKELLNLNKKEPSLYLWLFSFRFCFLLSKNNTPQTHQPWAESAEDLQITRDIINHWYITVWHSNQLSVPPQPQQIHLQRSPSILVSIVHQQIFSLPRGSWHPFEIFHRTSIPLQLAILTTQQRRSREPSCPSSNETHMLPYTQSPSTTDHYTKCSITPPINIHGNSNSVEMKYRKTGEKESS